jgi:hypothetical protein
MDLHVLVDGVIDHLLPATFRIDASMAYSSSAASNASPPVSSRRLDGLID